MSETLQIALLVGISAAATMLTRALPFLLFGGKRKLPAVISYLGTVLPAAIMVILVLYCLWGIDFSGYPFGLAELISLAAVIGLQIWKKNTIASIVAGTFLYMVLIRTAFPV